MLDGGLPRETRAGSSWDTPPLRPGRTNNFAPAVRMHFHPASLAFSFGQTWTSWHDPPPSAVIGILSGSECGRVRWWWQAEGAWTLNVFMIWRLWRLHNSCMLDKVLSCYQEQVDSIWVEAGPWKLAGAKILRRVPLLTIPPGVS